MRKIIIPDIILGYDRIFLILAGIGAIVFALFDLFGPKNLVRENPQITVVLVGLFLIGISIILTDSMNRIESFFDNSMNRQNTSMNRIDDSMNRIESLLEKSQGIEVIRFANAADVYDYVSIEMKKANNRIYDITWGSRQIRSQSEDEFYKKYVETIDEVCKRDKIIYKEISSLTNEHYFNRSINLLKYPNYHLGYYDLSQTTVPLMSYIIIDFKKVIVGFYKDPHLPSESEIYLLITDPSIVKLYVDYYEVLWFKSQKIKDTAETTKINRELIDQIRRKIAA